MSHSPPFVRIVLAATTMCVLLLSAGFLLLKPDVERCASGREIEMFFRQGLDREQVNAVLSGLDSRMKVLNVIHDQDGQFYVRVCSNRDGVKENLNLLRAIPQVEIVNGGVPGPIPN